MKFLGAFLVVFALMVWAASGLVAQEPSDVQALSERLREVEGQYSALLEQNGALNYELQVLRDRVQRIEDALPKLKAGE